MSVPTVPAPAAVTLPNSTSLTGQMLDDLTKALGVARTSLASDTQIAHAWSNLPRLLEKVPPHHRNETMVRMCVAVSTFEAILQGRVMKPRVFIGSSVEHLDLAYATQECLEHDVVSTVWSQGVFALSRTAMASLIEQLDESDFGIFVLAPDDVTIIRDTSKQTVRDNVIFELGLFIGRLGHDRCFLIVPRGVDDLHLPTDLLGITPAAFEPDRQDENLQAALGPACNRIRKAIQKLGAVTPAPPPVAVTSEPSIEQDLCSDPVDCEALIKSWMGARNRASNQRAIRYADVDRELNLVPGSARQHIEKAAAHYRFRAVLKGKDTITFQLDPVRVRF
ncbi:nucleotide-binding protein [Bradyrhizobium barranii subsp. barranii]|uniref:Nucleotide-binding protein n=1 Tax=Bradyrhizobium barranii subsp. barranii TaxID=2823807 RepID=A0A7Z0TSI7_9BRAD|nr:nucleotide-binding protein [Bradyrhizobium barranii]UEM17304.1 nucleotide-binding protein [Bradyrhizobium barranii subsp. barranii]UGX98273.1 nucleotide-binding protein [Bradyrhizobium barranii subsp. barranii]